MSALFEVLHATWPPAETRRVGPWILRRGEGGGSRVSAATLAGAPCEFEVAEAGMRAWSQRPVFMVRRGETALDGALADRGFERFDATVLMKGPAAAVARMPEGSTVFCETPLRATAEIWAAGGIGPARLAIMERAAAPRTWLLGRLDDRAAGAGFLAIHRGVAMLHALEVAPGARRAGLGAAMTRAAAGWAMARGAETLALAVTKANGPALALYGGLGLREVGGYHYRGAVE